MSGRQTAATGAVALTALLTFGCGHGVEPSKASRLTLMTITASDSCRVGADGLPLHDYPVTMQDRRSGSDWLFAENRDPGGPREQVLVLSLQEGATSLTGRISGPAIITTDLGRMTVHPDGMVTAYATASELTGTWSGRLSAWVTDGGTFHDCTATDHRLRLALPE